MMHCLVVPALPQRSAATRAVRVWQNTVYLLGPLRYRSLYPYPFSQLREYAILVFQVQ